MANSTFRNWHNHKTYSKAKELSKIFSPRINKNVRNGVDIIFEEPYGKKIIFELNEENTNSLLQQIQVLFPDFKTQNK